MRIANYLIHRGKFLNPHFFIFVAAFFLRRARGLVIRWLQFTATFFFLFLLFFLTLLLARSLCGFKLFELVFVDRNGRPIKYCGNVLGQSFVDTLLGQGLERTIFQWYCGEIIVELLHILMIRDVTTGGRVARFRDVAFWPRVAFFFCAVVYCLLNYFPPQVVIWKQALQNGRSLGKGRKEGGPGKKHVV